MADILIRGMEMPKTCCQCDLKVYDPELRWDENGIEQIGAWVCKRTREIIWNTQRGENCPLFPIPVGHGRLIDAGVFRNQLIELAKAGKDAASIWLILFVEEMLNNAPAIIEAEGGGEE